MLRAGFIKPGSTHRRVSRSDRVHRDDCFMAAIHNDHDFTALHAQVDRLVEVTNEPAAQRGRLAIARVENLRKRKDSVAGATEFLTVALVDCHH